MAMGVFTRFTPGAYRTDGNAPVVAAMLAAEYAASDCAGRREWRNRPPRSCNGRPVRADRHVIVFDYECPDILAKLSAAHLRDQGVTDLKCTPMRRTRPEFDRTRPGIEHPRVFSDEWENRPGRPVVESTAVGVVPGRVVVRAPPDLVRAGESGPAVVTLKQSGSLPPSHGAGHSSRDTAGGGTCRDSCGCPVAICRRLFWQADAVAVARTF